MNPTITHQPDRSLAAEPGRQAIRRQSAFWLLRSGIATALSPDRA